VAPPAAVNPALAQWDPSFSVDFTAAMGGNLSYAHLQPSGNRRPRWSNTFQNNEVVLSTRTPEIASVQHNGDQSATVMFANRRSTTLRFFGNAHTWSGHLLFNDNHVEFSENRISPGGTITPQSQAPVRYYFTAAGERHIDLWCFDEPDDPGFGNDYVGIFTAAGLLPSNHTPIWD
jgi:hypothetical protein